MCHFLFKNLIFSQFYFSLSSCHCMNKQELRPFLLSCRRFAKTCGDISALVSVATQDIKKMAMINISLLHLQLERNSEINLVLVNP